MKFLTLSIFVLATAILIAGCDTLKFPDMFSHDQVPDAVKAEPRLVEAPQPNSTNSSSWPYLGAVPSKPRDFSPPIVYNHYMNELEFQRDEAVTAKATALETDPVLDAPLPAEPQTPAVSKAQPLAPPQLPQPRKE